MSDDDWSTSFDKALDWAPTHLCEMGGDLTARLHEKNLNLPIKASL